MMMKRTITDHVAGILRVAIDPDFHNPFSDLLKKITEIDLQTFGKELNENVLVEATLSFYADSGKNHLKLVSLAGNELTISNEEMDRYETAKLKLQLNLARAEIKALNEKNELLEDELGFL